MRYLLLVIRHKFWVFRYGLIVGCPIWRLITHDLSKLGWKEYPHYQRIFYGDKSNQYDFNRAWLHHQNSNDHHWEYWWQRTGHDKATPRPLNDSPLPMCEGAVLEMVSDWMGATHAYDKKPVDINNWPWLDKHWLGFTKHLHPKTVNDTMKVLFRLGRKHLCP